MSEMEDHSLGAIPAGMRWCPHCNGYGSSLKEAGGRCSHCAGTGLVVDDARAVARQKNSGDAPNGHAARGGRTSG